MLALIALHLVAAAAAPLLFQRWGRNGFLALAVVPAAAAAWILAAYPRWRDGGIVLEVTPWLTQLDLNFTFQLDALSGLLALLVTGVGALVLVFCSRYFREDASGLGRLAGQLMAFAGCMLGLVLADNTLMMFVFWEGTTIFSYLLIGHSAHRKSSRRAAMQALIVTTAGGLAMLIGLIILGELRSYEFSILVADPPSGALVNVAIVLVLLGALSKSAIFPLHFWLPAAMAAPTPISAYLHAAAMVKAGVYLIARLAPGFATVPPWRPMILTLGLATMILGGWRALRQTDLKLVLAFGTVSQLGFMVVLVGSGSRIAALAGLAVLLAHALFKSTLFLTVGVIDQTTGTRDLTVLSGLARSNRRLAAIGTIAAMSMAGIPPLAGFIAKETAFEAYIQPTFGNALLNSTTLAIIVLGATLTVAYSARFVWGAFATKPGLPPPRCAEPHQPLWHRW